MSARIKVEFEIECDKCHKVSKFEDWVTQTREDGEFGNNISRTIRMRTEEMGMYYTYDITERNGPVIFICQDCQDEDELAVTRNWVEFKRGTGE